MQHAFHAASINDLKHSMDLIPPYLQLLFDLLSQIQLDQPNSRKLSKLASEQIIIATQTMIQLTERQKTSQKGKRR